jgi:hypothetical protein
VLYQGLIESNLHFCNSDAVKQQKGSVMSASGRKPWRHSELNLVKGASKQRQQEDKLRADAWEKNREAELEAVVNRDYDGMDIPEIRAVVEQAAAAMAPFIAEFDRLFVLHYPAEFAKATLGITITPGGIPPKLRNQVRRDAAKHLQARKAYMLANSAEFVTETLTDATLRTTDNPEVQEVLQRLAGPNRATPTLEPPGPAIGILRKLLPHPEEWGFAGYDGGASPLLPNSASDEAPKALIAPKNDT